MIGRESGWTSIGDITSGLLAQRVAFAEPSASNEADIVRDCLEMLRSRGIYAWRQNGGGKTEKDAGGRKHFVRFAAVPGISDIIGLLPGGRLLAIECKRPGETPTEHQHAFLSAIRRRGGLALLITDARDLSDFLDRELREAE